MISCSANDFLCLPVGGGHLGDPGAQGVGGDGVDKRVDVIATAIKAGLAVEDLERGLEADPNEAILHYNLACYLALDGQRERPLRYLRQAVDLDDSFLEHARGEEDFDSIRDEPEFRVKARKSAQ